jgi:DNA (cytosine-5)-methyltransferase 3A
MEINKIIKVLSLFDGISCARMALDRLGYKDITYYASEIDKYAIKIAQKNWPDIINLGDIKDVLKYDLPKFDLLIGGSPCQDLSIVKKNREGLAGKRSGLFWEYVRILKEVKPKYFVLENVNSMPKEAKQIITETLGVEPIMINASLVSAQNRKRLFWVGKCVGNTYRRVEIPQPKDKRIFLKDILEDNVDKKYNIDAKKIYGDNGKMCPLNNWSPLIRVGQIGNGGQGDRIYSPDGKSVNLSANGGGRGAKTGLYAVAQRGRNIVNGKRKDILGAKTQQRIEVGQSDKAHTITSVFKDSMIMKNFIIRKLTPIECERLQSLDDNYTVGVSNTQRYKCLGNAFNVEVVKHILKNLIMN